MNNGGKGSSPRPFGVTQQEYDAKWQQIFAKKRSGKFTVVATCKSCGAVVYADGSVKHEPYCDVLNQ